MLADSRPSDRSSASGLFAVWDPSKDSQVVPGVVEAAAAGAGPVEVEMALPGREAQATSLWPFLSTDLSAATGRKWLLLLLCFAGGTLFAQVNQFISTGQHDGTFQAFK